MLYFTVVTASHGVLDALTNGGLGIAFFAPFDSTRYFFAWRPVRVSPISITAFFSRWGVRIVLSEMLYIWLPTGLLLGLCTLGRYVAASKIFTAIVPCDLTAMALYADGIWRANMPRLSHTQEAENNLPIETV